jgi:septal ring factor EnvC (AmiA/AmiB activator)
MTAKKIATAAAIALALSAGRATVFCGELPASPPVIQSDVVPTLSEVQAELAQTREALTQAEQASDYLPAAELKYLEAKIEVQNGHYDTAMETLKKVRALVHQVLERKNGTLASR